jgi:pyruvate dehydrogenase E2 component (dihydrolipoamide acetyltransferase)
MGIFRMPSLGSDMEAGTLVEWAKQPGDSVRRGDIIAVVETQKGAIEIEVFESGVIEQHLLPIGATVPVGTAMASIRAEGESAAALASPVIAAPAAAPVATPPAATISLPQLPKGIEKPASPAARKFAADHGLDLSTLLGSGPDGAIQFVDVETAWQQQRSAATAQQVPPPAAPASDGMRSAIAASMARAKREIPHYYLGHTVDVTAAIDWLARRNSDRSPADRAVFAVLLLKTIARALQKFPEFNGAFAQGRFVPSAQIHLGMAVALRGGGLLAPAIHDTANLSLDQLMAQLRDLTNRVRAGRFRSSELADATCTLTSLGERGVDWVLPIIYPPQVAIIGAGSPAERPWVVDGEVRVRHICELTLAADHRVSDGHRGALFLRAVSSFLQEPEAV